MRVMVQNGRANRGVIMLQVVHAAVRKFVAEIKAGGPPSGASASSGGDGAANGAPAAAAAAGVKARCAAPPSSAATGTPVGGCLPADLSVQATADGKQGAVALRAHVHAGGGVLPPEELPCQA